MSVKSIYVSKKFESFWARAEKKAARQHTTMADYIGRLVRNDVMLGGAEATVDELLDDVQTRLDAVRKLMAQAPAAEEA